jgi:sulfate adenylyltransferase subunit 1
LEQDLDLMLCWMDSKPLKRGGRYLLQLNSLRVNAIVKDLVYKLNVNSLVKEDAPEQAGLNDIIRATIRTAAPIPFDAYKDLPSTGGAILIDVTSNLTVGACMIQ